MTRGQNTSRDLDALLKSDDFPTEPDVLESIQQRHRECTDVIASIDSQLIRLRARLDSLESQRRYMKGVLSKCKLVMSPARRLPHDVLAYIFDFYAEVYDSELSYRRPPWVLGWVCRQWRSSVLSLPRLWTTFDLDLILEIDSSAHSIPTQLERCRDQSIQITIGDLSAEVSNKVLSMLCSDNRASSWSHASMPMDAHIFEFLRPYTGLFTGLRCLHLDGIDVDHDANADGVSLDVFQNAPALNTVSIWGENDCVDDLKLPWNQITHYTARDSEWFYATNSFHFTILPRLENLQICWLDCIVLDEGTPAPNSPILLPFLHTLILSCAEPDFEGNHKGPPQVLDHLTLPALHTLRLRNGFFNTLHPLLRLVERSKCCLRDLALCALHTSHEEDVLSLIKSGALKDLQVFWIGWGSAYNSETEWVEVFNLRVFRPLVRTSEQEDYLPSLRCFQTNDWDMDTLITIINSRHPIDDRQQSLDCLVLRDHRDWLPARVKERRAESEEKLRELCERGLRLEWGGTDFPEV
ncbi:hypothetical protein AAF712_014611 [Marasmius tenuissimus]|uniref:F-box domain-containing protein n=1 Tax=Marasmius tenuissimus TaxID=585030 RepID=A0ABR2ZBS2_9AGAR